MQTKKEAAILLLQWQTLFEPLFNKGVNIKFGSFDWKNLIIKEIRLAKLGALKNAPDKRAKTDKEGQYTPLIMEVITTDGILAFVMEDIQVAAIMSGIRITIEENIIEMRLM